MTAIANVSLNNTFQEQMTTLNQVIVKLAQVESNSVNLVSNSSVIQLSGAVGTGNVIYITSNAFSSNGGTIGGNVVISGNLQVKNVATLNTTTFIGNVTISSGKGLSVANISNLDSITGSAGVLNHYGLLKGQTTNNNAFIANTGPSNSVGYAWSKNDINKFSLISSSANSLYLYDYMLGRTLWYINSNANVITTSTEAQFTDNVSISRYLVTDSMTGSAGATNYYGQLRAVRDNGICFLANTGQLSGAVGFGWQKLGSTKYDFNIDTANNLYIWDYTNSQTVLEFYPTPRALYFYSNTYFGSYGTGNLTVGSSMDIRAGSANAIFLPGGGYISGGVINLL